MKNVPEQIEKYKKKKYYLHATELLVSTGLIYKHFIAMVFNNKNGIQTCSSTFFILPCLVYSTAQKLS